MATERLTAADGPQGDDWATQAPSAPATPAETPQERQERQEHAQDNLAVAIYEITRAVSDLNANLAGAMEQHTDDLNYEALADTAAWIQDLRRTLGEAEGYVARELGRMDATPEIITLSDGRTAQVLKGKDRKEWRHDDWKRDVRAAVIASSDDLAALTFVNYDGEVLPQADVLQPLLAQVQAVHGSAAPKVTALKPLGLSADDYCTSYPGPYSVRISAPEASNPTQEN
jgi:hypothetical protein